MSEKSYDLIIIGGGPGGYVCAIKAAQLGLKVACVEMRRTLGGCCLNVGCIPSKVLLHSSQRFEEAQHHLGDHGIEISGVKLNLKKFLDRKNNVVEELAKGIDFLFKKNKIDFINGKAEFISKTEVKVDGKTVYSAKNFVIATGSEVVSLPGITIDEKQIVSSTGALELPQVPKHLVVIGGGYIGLELGTVWRRLGAKVTVVEFADRIVPAMDHEIGDALHRELKKQGIDFNLSTKVTEVKKDKSGLTVTLEPASGGKAEHINCDVLLSCAGRKPYTGGLGLENLGIELDERGRIPVNGAFQTSVPHIFALGDVIDGPMLAHKAEEEGVAVAEILAGQHPHINYNAIPGVVYTHPEVATVGKTEEDLKKANISYKVGKFPFMANARAKANGETVGMVKILSDKASDEVLGVHIIHSEAGTMISECVLALEYRASSEDIARTCHPHPTVSEAIKEAALAAYSKAIHA
ncbi:MAG: dihydrolipoyl dehydrogenase [Alphaproteobacteria bacterium]|nr:dihydrolipoyl dehydrogenase [Alphaproteobacteria bacterium]NCQ67186.1 dihydrolipoyl dehydrogenase [Alphaproteobacteria bacterium]NCT07031.1 dihydrolipoyl dehydrogenase [Alphaproteobacteria bacterium]